MLRKYGVSRRMASKKIRIELVRSVIGTKPNQRRTIKALGLGRVHSVVEKEDTSLTRGMINTVLHLVKTEEVK